MTTRGSQHAHVAGLVTSEGTCDIIDGKRKRQRIDYKVSLVSVAKYRLQSMDCRAWTAEHGLQSMDCKPSEPCSPVASYGYRVV